MKYITLAELKKAYDSGELSRKYPLVLDNDVTYVYVEGECVFRSDPGTDLSDALDILGMPWEDC